MSSRICIPIRNGRINWCSTCKLISWCTAWYLLCCSILPLCLINRSSLHKHRRIQSVIPTIHWTCYKLKMMEGSICCNIRRSKCNILPTTFPRISWNSMTIHRLPRYLHYMKHHLLNRINILFHKSNNIPFHHLRKNYIKPTNPTFKELSRMIIKLPARRYWKLPTIWYYVFFGLYFWSIQIIWILLIMCVCVCVCVCVCMSSTGLL